MSMPAPTATSGSPFKGSTVLWGVLASLLAAAGFVLLSTYARWLNSTSDWTELQKLENRPNGTKLVQAE